VTPHGRPRRDAGFTFTELIAITAVVGLLAAIAIPAVLHHRERAHDGAAKSLVRTAGSAVEAASAEAGGYAALTPAALHAAEPAVTFRATGEGDAAADAVAVTLGDAGYELVTTSRSGTRFRLRRDAGADPPVSRTCGAGCTW
jgi:Tfp pilus assembly protein PilE